MIINKLRTLPQYLIPQIGLSNLMGKLANQSTLNQIAINWFVKHYQVNMSEAKQPNISHYKTFNDFFTRELKDGTRPFDTASEKLISPVDGMISQIGDIDQGRIIQAKGRDYSVLELLGGQPTQAEPFRDGKFATLYLSPKDYHRVHMPIDGILKSMTYIPGKLFAVKPLTAETVPELFARNERLAMFFETELGPMAVVMVGAMIVGAMKTTWHGKINRSKQIQQWDYSKEKPEKKKYNKGDELGLFQLGSTVILVLPNNSYQWQDKYSETSTIRMGETLATKNN